MKTTLLMLSIVLAIVLFTGCNTVKAVPYPTSDEIGYVHGSEEFEEWNYELRDSDRNRVAVLPFTNQELTLSEGGYYLGRNKFYSFGKAFDEFNVILTNKIVHSLWSKNELKLSKNSEVLTALHEHSISISDLENLDSETKINLTNMGNELDVDFLLLGETIENSELCQIENKMFKDHVYDTERFAICGVRFHVLDVQKGEFIVHNSDRFSSKTRRTTRSEVSLATKAVLGIALLAIPKEQLDKELLLDSPVKEYWLTTPMLSENMLEKKAAAEFKSAIATAATGLAMKAFAVFAAAGAENSAESQGAARLYMTEVPIEFSWYEEDDTWRSYPAAYFMENFGYTPAMYGTLR